MPPPFILALTLATLYGCAAHALVGRRLWQWPLFWAAATIGVLGGYLVDVALGLGWLLVGTVPLLSCSLGAGLFLAGAWYFSAPYATARQS